MWKSSRYNFPAPMHAASPPSCRLQYVPKSLPFLAAVRRRKAQKLAESTAYEEKNGAAAESAALADTFFHFPLILIAIPPFGVSGVRLRTCQANPSFCVPLFSLEVVRCLVSPRTVCASFAGRLLTGKEKLWTRIAAGERAGYPLTNWLLALAVCLFVFDVAMRRFQYVTTFTLSSPMPAFPTE